MQIVSMQHTTHIVEEISSTEDCDGRRFGAVSIADSCSKLRAFSVLWGMRLIHELKSRAAHRSCFRSHPILARLFELN